MKRRFTEAEAGLSATKAVYIGEEDTAGMDDADDAGSLPDGDIVPEVAASEAEPALLLPFSYCHPAVANLGVTSLSWNKLNQDLLAVGYGRDSFLASSASDMGGALAL